MFIQCDISLIKEIASKTRIANECSRRDSLYLGQRFVHNFRNTEESVSM